jgi:DNA-binding beta-propeller fold protein YncE
MKTPPARRHRAPTTLACLLIGLGATQACTRHPWPPTHGPGQSPGSHVGRPTGQDGGGAVDGLPLGDRRDVILPGGATELDYLSVDAARQRVYVAHRGDDSVDVVDVRTMAVVGTVHDVGQAHGVWPAPELHKVFATATKTNEVIAFDDTTFQIVSRTPTGDHPDGLVYDPAHGKVYVSDEHDHTETVVDAKSGKNIGTIDIRGEAGNTIRDTRTGNILVNVQTAGHIAVIDPAGDKVIDEIPVPECESNHGLRIDSDRRLAFSACEDNAKLVVIDMTTKKALANFDVGENPDGVAYDQRLGRIYVASDGGTIAVFTVAGCNTVSKVAQAQLDSAHTVEVDARTHAVYFPIEDKAGHDTLAVLRPRPLRRADEPTTTAPPGVTAPVSGDDPAVESLRGGGTRCAR